MVYMLVFLATAGLSRLAQCRPVLRRVRSGRDVVLPDTAVAALLTLSLALVAGLRYNVGTDFWNYYRWRALSWQTLWRRVLAFREPGFELLVKLVRAVANHGQSVILVCAILTVTLYGRVYHRYARRYMLAMLLYLFLGMWQGCFNGIRQYLAAAILLSGHRLMLERKFWKYCAVVLLASLFHASALIMIVPYFLYGRRPNATQVLLLAAGAALIRLSYDLVFRIVSAFKGRTISLTSTRFNANDVNPLRILAAFAPLLMYALFCRKTRHTREQDFYINALFFNAFAMFAGMGSAYLARIGIYTDTLLPLAYGHLLDLIDDDQSRLIAEIAILALFFIYWIYSVYAGHIQAFRFAL